MSGGSINRLVVIALTMELSSASRGRWGWSLPRQHLFMPLRRPLGHLLLLIKHKVLCDLSMLREER